MLCLGGQEAVAAEVEVCAGDEPSALISEALVRIRAELKAAGFSVERQLCSEAPVDLGGIELLMEAGGLRILATSIASQGTMTQLVDLSQPTITAEVIAVRAVESFRAVLLQSLRSGELEEQLISRELRQFTQYGLQPELATHVSSRKKSAQEAVSPQKRRTAPDHGRKRPRLGALFSVGPSLDLYPRVGGANLGGEVRAILAYGGITLGVLGHASLTRAHASLGETKMATSFWSVLLRPGVSIPCSPGWECHLGLLGGIYQGKFVLDEPGASSVVHESWSLQGEAMVARFFGSGVGVGVQLRGGGLLNAPILSSSRDDASLTWGRPMLSLGLSLAYRL